MRGAGPFSDRIESSVPSAVLQVLRWRRAFSDSALYGAGGYPSSTRMSWLRAPDNAGYRWLGRPAVTLKVCRGDRGRNAGLLPARPNWMRTMTLEQTASLRADVIKLNPLIAYNPPWRG